MRFVLPGPDHGQNGVVLECFFEECLAGADAAEFTGQFPVVAARLSPFGFYWLSKELGQEGGPFSRVACIEHELDILGLYFLFSFNFETFKFF